MSEHTMDELILTSAAGRYRWHENWATIPSPCEKEGRTHGVVVTRGGHIYVFHQCVPAMLAYGPDGRLLNAWGNYPGAHGLTLVEENGREYLWLTDQDRHIVEKTTLDGDIVARVAPPSYANADRYVPTWVAVNESRFGGNGDIWIADGYGSSRITRYSAAGVELGVIDGRAGAGRFDCPHGIWFDRRKRPMELYVADRGNHRIQVLNREGEFLRSFGNDFLTSPDCFALDGERLIIPELRGRVTILDAADQLVCHIGNHEEVASDPAWPNGTVLEPGKFNSPHSVAVDEAGSLFIVEWRTGGRILKLEKLP